MINIYVIRHGETMFNKEGRYLGRTDVPLILDFKINELDILKERIKNLQVDFVVTSPLRRCVETVKVLTGTSDVLINDKFIERSVGVYEGLTKEEVKKKYPDIYLKNITRLFNDAPPGGETITEVEKRVFAGLDQIKDLYKDKKILIVTHGFVIKVINKYFNPGISNEDFFSFSLKNLELKEYFLN